MFPTVVILQSKDGGVQHAVAVVNEFIFESNQKNVMKLSKASLDWCCGENDSFDGIYKAFRVSYPTRGLEVNKKTQKREKKHECI